MKRNNFFTKACFLVLCAGAVFMSCEDDPELRLSSVEEVFDSYPLDTVEVRISSNVAWEVTIMGNVDWLTVEPASGRRNGTITILASENPEFESRTALIVVSGDRVRADTIRITQAADFDILASITDLVFRQYCLDNFDINKDGIISTSEARKVEDINVVGMQIRSLAGIEHFTEMWELNCTRNGLSSLDLSKNTKLQFLYCENNAIENLDLSNNKLLKTVRSGWNTLNYVNITGLTELEDIELYFGNFETIDLSTNTSLGSLALNRSSLNRQLSSLDVSHNTKLSELRCNGTGLTSLNLSNNTDLASLYCEDNRLQTLDLSNNTKLLTLYCGYNSFSGGTVNVSSNVELLELSCVGANITSLNLTNNAKLNKLFINDNRISSLNLATNTGLTEINASNNTLSGILDLSRLTNAQSGELKFDFRRNPNLHTIEVPVGFILRTYLNENIRWDGDEFDKAHPAYPNSIWLEK